MLIAKDIVKSYQSTKVLFGVSLTVKDGEFVSIMGESGSGKSTLLSILSGNMRADSGEVIIDGEKIDALDESRLAKIRREKIGFVYQNLNLVPTLSAEDNILLPALLAKKSLPESRKKLRLLAEKLEITELLKKLPDQMSGGQRQRVAIARALINNPKILMLDEPTGSLDSRTTKEVLDLLLRINHEDGISIIQITHSSEAASVGDRIIKILDGRIAE